LLNLHESTQNDRRKPTQAGERKNRLNSLHWLTTNKKLNPCGAVLPTG
jgi:hypothetical protein